jgi:structural maintenance of chromosome 2
VEKDMKREEKSAEQLSAKKLTVSQRVSNLQQNLDSMEFSPTEYNTLETTKVELQNSLSSLHEQLDTLTAQLQGRLRFQYSDPVRGFDRSKVKGLVARLVTVKNSQHATALEVVAGGKLYQVVVDEAITGKALLSRGKLQRRVTLIPLDKITPRRVTHSAVQRASALAQDMNTTASPAIELVGFEEEVRNALEYVFGSSLVVDGTEAANRICDATRTRTVTLEGDVYDPSGTISGGSRNNLGTTLAKLTEVSCMSAKVKEEESRLAKVNANLEQMKSSSKKFDQFSDQLELARAELKAVEKHLSQTSYGMLLDKFTSMRMEVDDAAEVAKTMEAERVAKWDLYNELKEKELELTKNREAKLKEVDQKVKEAKKICAAKNEESRKVRKLYFFGIVSL